jgi:hypothetical protein
LGILDLYQKANYFNTEHSNLLQIGLERGTYFFEGRVIGDVFGIGRYSQFINCASTTGCELLPPSQMIEKMNHLKATLLLISSTQSIDNQYALFFDRLYTNKEGVLFRIKESQHLPPKGNLW